MKSYVFLGTLRDFLAFRCMPTSHANTRDQQRTEFRTQVKNCQLLQNSKTVLRVLSFFFLAEITPMKFIITYISFVIFSMLSKLRDI